MFPAGRNPEFYLRITTLGTINRGKAESLPLINVMSTIRIGDEPEHMKMSLNFKATARRVRRQRIAGETRLLLRSWARLRLDVWIIDLLSSDWALLIGPKDTRPRLISNACIILALTLFIQGLGLGAAIANLYRKCRAAQEPATSVIFDWVDLSPLTPR